MGSGSDKSSLLFSKVSSCLYSSHFFGHSEFASVNESVLPVTAIGAPDYLSRMGLGELGDYFSSTVPVPLIAGRVAIGLPSSVASLPMMDLIPSYMVPFYNFIFIKIIGWSF